MTWLTLLLLALAAFTVWEWLLVVLPIAVPAALQPLAVVLLAYEAQQLPRAWLLAVAAAGVVALLHTVVRSGVVEPSARTLRLPRRRPAGLRRVPDLP